MTLQEIQYKAQGIIRKWRDDDSAPYIEFVEELAHMIVPEPSDDLEEAAEKYASSVEGDYAFSEGPDHYCSGDLVDAFVAGAKWQKGQDEKEQADLFTIVALDAAERAKQQMLKEAGEYEVWDFSSSLEAHPHVNIPLDNKQYRSGDKVRVIVLPKED